MILALLLSALVAAQAPAAPDPRSADAVALFDDMCVRTMLGQPPAQPDPARFIMKKVDEKDARQTLPEYDPNKVWGALGKTSKVEMYIGTTPAGGVCSAEVLAADRPSMQADFDRLVQRTAAGLGTTATIEMQNDNPINGKPASLRAWRVKAPGGDILIALTAASEARPKSNI